MHLSDRVKYLITGGLAGLANGFFGTGGGLFLVPLFIGWLHMESRRAFAASVAVILPLCAVSVWVCARQGNLNFAAAQPYLIGGALGGLLSGKLFRRLNMIWLRRIFGLFILYGGVRALFLR